MDIETLITRIASDNQRISDREDALEQVFGKSMIIPSNKINGIIVGLVLMLVSIVLILCLLFGFVWWLDRPL